jgi:hypothetical protein
VEGRIQLTLCVLAGAGSFGLVGALVGAVAGLYFHAHGKAAGGFFGPALLRAVERVLREEVPGPRRAVLGGAVEGGTFLTLVGVAAGGCAGLAGQGPVEVLLYGAALAVLAFGAVLFGVLAYGMARVGVNGLGWLVAGAVVGTFLGAWLTPGLLARWGMRNDDAVFGGLLGGAALGAALAGGGARVARWVREQTTRGPGEPPDPPGEEDA